MKRKSRFTMLVCISLALAAPNLCCAGQPQRLNLSRKEAVDRAIRYNLDAHNEALNTSIAKAEVARSRSLYDPMLSVSATRSTAVLPGENFGVSSSIGSLGVSQNLPTGGNLSVSGQSGYTNADSALTGAGYNNWQSSVAVTVSQPLLKNAGKKSTELNITVAGSNLQDAVERYRQYLTDMALSVIASYNHLYSLRNVQQAKVEGLNAGQKLLNEIKSRPKPGSKQKLEVANLEYAMAQRRRELVDAERSVRDHEANFRYLIGMSDKIEINPTDPPAKDEPSDTEAQAVASALQNRSDLKQLRLALKTSELQSQVARRQTLPDLSVTATAGVAGSAAAMGGSFSQMGQGKGAFWSAGLQLTVPIGNRAASNDYLKSTIRTEQAQNQLKATEWKVRNDIEADMRALMSARLQNQTTEQALRFAEQRRVEYQKHIKSGESTVQDAINADNDLTTARSAQLDAAETYSLAVAKLWRDAGSLLDHLGVRVEPPRPEKTAGSAPLS